MCRSKMAPKLYMTELSPAVRSVLLAAKAMGITLQQKLIDLRAGDHLKPEYIKMNPQHTVPTLEDNGYVIWDSHAIMAYLVGKYAKDDSLYPRECNQRGVIDQRLHFDTGVAFAALRNTIRPMIYKGVKTIPQENLDAINETYDFLEKFLEGNQWIAGNSVSIADFSLIPTVTSLNVIVPISEQKHPNLDGWLKRARCWPYYDANSAGLKNFTEFYQAMKN